LKTKHKVLFLCLCVTLILGVSMLGSLAYMTDRDSVVNTFTAGKVGLALDEALVDPDGTPVPGADRVKQNTYHLIPGQSYVKDPTLRILADSEEAYVRLLVTINEIAALQAIFGADFLPEDYASGWDAETWPCVAISDVKDDSITYEFRYKETVSGEDGELVLPALFTGFTVPGALTAEQLATLDELKITVVGHGIQAATFADAEEAWAAFGEQFPDLSL